MILPQKNGTDKLSFNNMKKTRFSFTIPKGQDSPSKSEQDKIFLQKYRADMIFFQKYEIDQISFKITEQRVLSFKKYIRNRQNFFFKNTEQTGFSFKNM